MRKGFTLIELLVVIAVVTVLAVTVVVTLNPVELLRQARDSNRTADLASLNKALAIVETEVQGASFGSTSTVYVSIPDSSSTCANLGLPTLPGGYSYACVASTSLTKVDGTGWVPVNLTQISSGSPLSRLPVDPVNTTSTGQYYTYNPGGSWELTAQLEAAKRVIAPGSPHVMRVGSRLGTTPNIRGDMGLVGYWPFDEGSGIVTQDLSGYSNTGTLSGAAWQSAGNCKQGTCLSFGGVTHVNVPDAANLNFGSGSYTISAYINTAGGAYQVAVGKGSGASADNFRAFVTATNEIGLWWGGDAQYYHPFSPAIPLGTWVHAVWGYDAATGKVFYGLNGAYSAATATNHPVSNSLPLKIGRDTNGYNFNGRIDDVRVYSRALSAAEIQAIYNATQ